ncbi:MarR family winged helix-turn-helix transcriptional regulator [Kineococcus sp. SYSU DK003]|uniref:MarR family winged helix-turn-helix transcriptional regulator n=1 Tax=Kineococcus sp. SYSU DK003 TaxID=3383124 RepID=UPI003D7D8068
MTRLSDERLRALARALPALSWEMRRAGEHRLALSPLPPTELEIIRLVLAHPGLRAADVAHRLAVKPSNVSAAVTSLVARGLVDRVPDPADRRVLHLHPTAQAVREHEALAREWAGVLGEAVAQLSPPDAEALAAAVDALAHLTATLATQRAR